MDFKQVQEIFNSPKTYEVFYMGIPVWIENLNTENNTVKISSEELPQENLTVTADQLSFNEPDEPGQLLH